MASGECLKTYEGHSGRVETAVFSPDGQYILSASRDKTIKLWEFVPLQELVESAKNRFKNVPLTKEELREFYLE